MPLWLVEQLMPTPAQLLPGAVQQRWSDCSCLNRLSSRFDHLEATSMLHSPLSANKQRCTWHRVGTPPSAGKEIKHRM